MPAPLVDTYLHWARASAFRDAGGPPGDAGRWVWLLIELRPGRTAAEWARQAAACPAWLRVPAHYAAPPAGLDASRYCTAIASADFLAALSRRRPALPAAAAALHAAIARFEIGFTTRPWPAGAAPAAPAAVAPVQPPPAVVVGVIDDGLAFAHQRCRTADGLHSRFLSLWDQDAWRPDEVPAGGPWGYGRVLSQRAIDALLRQACHHGVVDEDMVYARAGYRAVGHRITHGTHVLDLACGQAPSEVGPATPRIVGVQIPGRAIEDTSCASMAVFLLDGVRHVLTRADQACGGGAPCPVVINLSMGHIAGPHDGSSIFERALDELVAQRPRTRVVLPSGNSYLARCHAWIDLPADAAPLTLAWRLRPADRTPSFVELWFGPPHALAPAPDLRGLQLLLRPPGGLAPLAVQLDGPPATLRAGGGAIATLSLTSGSANGDPVMGLAAVAPTETLDPAAPVAPSGVWTIEIRHVRAATQCRAFVQRDDIAFGRRGHARQSTFEDPDYRRHDARGAVELADDARAYLRRVGTLNGMASGARVDIAAGAQAGADGVRPARYSATPLTEAGPRPGLHVLAVSDDSPVLHGVLGAGTRSGAVVALSGTSVAAPQLTRFLAAHPQAMVLAGAQAGQVEDPAFNRRAVLATAPARQAQARRRRGG